ncbi:MAG TPA: cell division protein FtsB [Gammaproteobacteria bacterium]|nr:cell division protein FtsB [Gammaproteobacteria bacterium]
MKLPRDISWGRLLPLILLLLLALLQYQLWFGVGSVPDAMRLKSLADAQAAENAALVKRNATLEAEVADLKQGTAAIEERARTELGMVKKGETFYQIVQAPPPAPKP